MADYSELKRKAQEIRNEVKAGANTANRVGLAIEELISALETENQRAEQAEVSLGNAVQALQDETEDLQSMRDAIDVLGTNKADKSALETTNKAVEDTVKALETTNKAVEDTVKALETTNKAVEDTVKALETTNKAVEGKQDKLRYYTENTSTDMAVIKVSHDSDEATPHEDKVEVGVDNCVLLKSEDLLLGEESYIKVSPEKVSVSSPQGKITDLIQTIRSLEARIANLEAQLTNTTEEP